MEQALRTTSSRVPRKDNKILYNWVDWQRSLFRDGKMPNDRMKRLNELGRSRSVQMLSLPFTAKLYPRTY